MKQKLIVLAGGILFVLLMALFTSCSTPQKCSWDKTQFSNHYQRGGN